MVELILQLLTIATICVIVIDVLRFGQMINRKAARFLSVKPEQINMKPFTCSLCMTFWIGLIHLIIIGRYSMYTLLLLLIISLMTRIIESLIYLIQDMMGKIIQIIDNMING